MKGRTLPNSNPALDRNKIAVKRSGIRAIDQGTRYDLTGNLRRLAREIERGEHGDARAIGVVMQGLRPGGGRGCYVAAYGGVETETVHWMFSTAANRTEPA